jgi:hypothetical protein
MGRLWKQAASREVMISKIIKEYKYSQEGFEVKVEWIEGYKNCQQLGNICVFNTSQYFLSRLRKKCKDCNLFLFLRFYCIYFCDISQKKSPLKNIIADVSYGD